MNPKIISVREHPEIKDQAIKYFQTKWPSVPPHLYEDSINQALNTEESLPQWYLLKIKERIIGCGGLIQQELITRSDIYPWLCALFIDEEYRGNNYASLLIDQAKFDSNKAGFKTMYLVSDLDGYYEKLGFQYFEEGHYPAGEVTMIYSINLT